MIVKGACIRSRVLFLVLYTLFIKGTMWCFEILAIHPIPEDVEI